MSMSRWSSFGSVTGAERRQADLFYADLLGGRTSRNAIAHGEGDAESTDSDLAALRTRLVASIRESDLYWHDIPLQEGCSIRVSSPVLKERMFLPVNGQETLDLARRFQVFPLSRAVMDQVHNATTHVAKPASPTNLYDFVTYSQRLDPTAYGTQYGYALASGAHKLWVLSSRGATINYGFYIPRTAADPVRCGPTLDRRYNVIQSLGARHNAAHWDYSQLLQFMTGLRNSAGQRMDLRQALLDRHPAVWDETAPPAAAGLP